jgi:hypothetical protein
MLSTHTSQIYTRSDEATQAGLLEMRRRSEGRQNGQRWTMTRAALWLPAKADICLALQASGLRVHGGGLRSPLTAPDICIKRERSP